MSPQNPTDHCHMARAVVQKIGVKVLPIKPDCFILLPLITSGHLLKHKLDFPGIVSLDLMTLIISGYRKSTQYNH